jgi:chromosome segregation ATPase
MKSLALLSMATGVAANAPMQKIIALLGELKVKVQGDLENEAASMKEYLAYCDDEITETGFNIKTATNDIARYEAVIEESSGKIDEFASTIEAGGSQIAKKRNELAAAKKVREAEKSDYKAAEKELVDAVDMLSRAIVVLKRGLSFAQMGNTSGKVGDVVKALGAIVEASWVDARDAQRVKAFLQSEDELSLKQPQAKVVAYESKSGGIVDAIEDMKDKAEDNLQKLRKDEMNARHSFEMLAQSLEDAVANLEKEVSAATSSKGQTEEVKGKAEGDLAKTSDAKAADEKYLAKMESSCSAKDSEWKARQKSAADEMAALEKAVEILSGGVKAMFVQTKVAVKRVEVDDTRDRVVSLLRKLGRKFNSFGLMQVASSAGSDPFVKIRGMIESMVTKLEEQAAEEASHDAFCKEETAKSQKARETKTASVEKYQTRLDKAKAAISNLKQESSELQKEIAAIDKATQEATKIRTQEKKDNTKAAKDFKDSAEAVTQAIEVLREFYGGGASFVQQPEFADSNSDSANVIIGILETAQSDFSRLLAETETSEAEAAEAYDTLMQESAVSKAKKEASVKGKTSEVKSLEKNMGDISSDLETASKELDAVLEYIDKLKPQCESKAMSYEERKARRDAEISGLKEALEILAGDAVLLQKKAFLSRA